MDGAPSAQPASARAAGAKAALALACVVCLSAGCESTVALGSECPPIGKECIDPIKRPTPRPPVGEVDAGAGPKPVPEAGPPEPAEGGTPIPDGGGDEPDVQVPTILAFPGFDNPSFELTSGGPEGGNLGLFSSVEIEPWYACSGIVGARPKDDLRNAPMGEASPTDIILPTDQSTLVSMSFGLTGPATLGQQLNEPLQVGTEYGFTIDVVRSGEADVRLEVFGSDRSCVPMESLARSDTLLEGQGFQTLCFSFIPETSHSHIILLTSPMPGARVFLDNLRPTAPCR